MQASGSRRRELVAAAPLALVGLRPANAQWRPTRPITIVVPFAAGSGTDSVARLTAGWLSAELGVPVLVENRAGANGSLAAVAVARAAPDGHTLFQTTNTTHAANPALLKRLDYDPIADFAPIGRVGFLPFWLVVGAELPARTLAAFIALARARPGQLSYASGNSTGIVAGANIARLAGVELIHVPYRSTPPAMTDVIAGRVSGIVVDLAASLPFVREGRLRPLGVTTAARTALMPDVPSLAEQGLAGFDLTSWNAIFAPARTSPETIAALSAALLRVAARPDVVARLAELGFEVAASTPDALAAFVAAEIRRWGTMVRAAGIEPE